MERPDGVSWWSIWLGLFMVGVVLSVFCASVGAAIGVGVKAYHWVTERSCERR